MTQIQDAFQRAAKTVGLFEDYQTYRRVELPLDLSEVPVDERHLVRATKRVVHDWIETVPGALRWLDAGTDDTTARGFVSLFAPLPDQAPDLLRCDGEYYVVEGVQSRDSLRVSYQLALSRWTGNAPDIRTDEP